MTEIAAFLDRLAGFGDRPALVWEDRELSFREVCSRVDGMREELAERGIPEGAVVSLEADFSPAAIAAQLALMRHRCVVVPLLRTARRDLGDLRDTAEAEWIVRVARDESVTVEPTETRASHALIERLRAARAPGVIVFSSGSSGPPKAALHDIGRILDRFAAPRDPSRMLCFLQFDHLGGINTMLTGLANGWCLVIVAERSPDVVAAAVERHDVRYLPVSPTFLNLLIMSDVDQRHDLSGLEVISYGSEPMSSATVKAVHARFPSAKLHQTYGLTELGLVPTRSRAPDSAWMRLGGDSVRVRARDGLLEVKSHEEMLGYLNAPSPFTEDGWFMTGDAVEVDGDWMRVLGRESDLVNVGGEKVTPTEVEGVLEEMDGVEEAVVGSAESPITGQIVCATVRLSTGESAPDFRRRMRAHCRGRLERHEVPQKVTVTGDALHTDRFKKRRLAGSAADQDRDRHVESVRT